MRQLQCHNQTRARRLLRFLLLRKCSMPFQAVERTDQSLVVNIEKPPEDRKSISALGRTVATALVMSDTRLPGPAGRQRVRAGRGACVAGANVSLPGIDRRFSGPGLVLAVESPCQYPLAKEIASSPGGVNHPGGCPVGPPLQWHTGGPALAILRSGVTRR